MMWYRHFANVGFETFNVNVVAYYAQKPVHDVGMADQALNAVIFF